jgi:hypothetical protein
VADERLTIDVDVTGGDDPDKGDWQPYVWVPKEWRNYLRGNVACGRCGLPVFSLVAPEPGYWDWEGIGLAACPTLCCRCVGVPIGVEETPRTNGCWQGPS